MAEGSPQARAPPSGGGVSLKKEIGLLSACGIIVGNIIGSGIFVSPRGVLLHAGSVALALLVWGAAGALTALGALCYAELGLLIPRAGGDYAYVKDAFGDLVGFLRLWVSVLVILPTTQAVIALTFAAALLTPLAPWGCPVPEPALRLLAAAALLLLTWVGSASSRWATRLQDVCTAGKLGALGIVIAAGLYRLGTGRPGWLSPQRALHPWVPASGGGLALAFLQGSFAYGGWNFLNYGTEELIDPPRNLPRAIFISIPLVTGIYVAANAAYVTAMDPQEILQSEAVAVTFGERALGALAWTMPVGVALSTFGSINGSLFTCSRLFYAGAREGQLPPLLAMIHVERSTPVPALLLACASTLVMLVGGDTGTLLSHVGFANLLWYGLGVSALLRMRRRAPRRPAPLTVWLWVPVLYVVVWALLLLFSLWAEPLVCGVGLGVTATGAPLYLIVERWGARYPPLRRAVASLTRFGQQLCLVVYPDCEPQSEPQSEPHSEPHSGPHSDLQPHVEQQQPLTCQPHN